MLVTLTLLSLVCRIPDGLASLHACVPNSQFHVNGVLCVCDGMGRWNEASCHASTKRQSCSPGQIIWEDCTQCICQENRNLVCANMCGEDTKRSQVSKAIDVKRLWCIPFVSYYVNCSLCVCPATGKMNEARCATDASCPFRGSIDYLAAIKNNVCIPKVMYLFPCLHCLCSDDGFFIIYKCVDTCQKVVISSAARRCLPMMFYRKNCNICFCPDTGLINERFCTKTDCSGVQFQSLAFLRNKTRRCLRQTFTESKCFYCECSKTGVVNEMTCLESECISIDNLKYNLKKTTCTPGELVPICMNCFCLHTGVTDPKYCTKACSNQQKLTVLESAINESFSSPNIIDRKHIPASGAVDICEPNSVYKEHGRFCLCPENGGTKLKLCTSATEDYFTERNKITLRGTPINIDFNVPCDPNSFVEFDCNSCYCLKSGKIDPKWCTYDDCEAKRLVIENNKRNYKEPSLNTSECVPGTMSQKECNFCICPESGRMKERACTKNSCANIRNTVQNDFTCEPQAYYNVDCNICYCPKSGIKNIAKCTKHTCEKTYLRSENCTPGRLFSEECNVCVCPPNGNKVDRVCTNNTCEESETPWKKIFKLSQTLLTYQVPNDITRDLELCFPGEEFEVGCKVCLCPDMGLRSYATCSQMLCDDYKSSKVIGSNETTVTPRMRRNAAYTDSSNNTPKKKECTPGSMYIIKCRQCICPYMGNINHFCRPLPKGTFCEEPFHVSMGRRIDAANGTTVSPLSSVAHQNTIWKCDKAGRVMDECFICECKGTTLVVEDCFQRDDEQCVNKTPSFLAHNKLPSG